MAWSSLQRRGYMKRGTLNRVSKRQAAKNRKRSKAMVIVAERCNGMCEVKGCNLAAVDGHEVLSRGRGGDATDVTNIIAVCRFHHDEIHRRSLWAQSQGLLKTQYLSGKASA